MVVEDDSFNFKQQGAVPFKWEIKPGLPIANKHPVPDSPSPKLRPPPPIGSYDLSPVEPRTRSFRTSSRVRSDQWRFERPLLARPHSVSSGCFFSPFLKRLRNKKMVPKRVVEPDCESEIETFDRWSLSSTKSPSPFRVSTVSSSPRPVSDVEWAGFALF